MKKILVIDDNMDMLELVKRILSKTEYEVLTADEAKNGIELARRERPDLILLDIVMPDIDGFTTIKYIRQIEGIENIPVIFLTGKKTSDGRSIALRTGAVDYIAKPFSPGDFLTKIENALI